MMKRYMALGAVLTALGVGGAAIGHNAAAGGAAAAQSQGGLAVTPALIEHNSQTGPLATVTVTNRSATALAVTVTPRPWTQSASGKVSANRRATLAGQIGVSKGSFTLAPGAEERVGVTLNSVPPAGALYGALEVVGLPADAATRHGVVLGYRVIGTLRIRPSVPKLDLVASAPKAVKGTAVLPVRNNGNTLDPVTGTITVKGAAGTRESALQAVRILPAKTINVPLGTKLTPGSYTATVTLRQKGKKALSIKKRFTVK
jgi:hypothetical protein